MSFLRLSNSLNSSGEELRFSLARERKTRRWFACCNWINRIKCCSSRSRVGLIASRGRFELPAWISRGKTHSHATSFGHSAFFFFLSISEIRWTLMSISYLLVGFAIIFVNDQAHRRSKLEDLKIETILYVEKNLSSVNRIACSWKILLPVNCKKCSEIFEQVFY